MTIRQLAKILALSTLAFACWVTVVAAFLLIATVDPFYFWVGLAAAVFVVAFAVVFYWLSPEE